MPQCRASLEPFDDEAHRARLEDMRGRGRDVALDEVGGEGIDRAAGVPALGVVLPAEEQREIFL